MKPTSITALAGSPGASAAVPWLLQVLGNRLRHGTLVVELPDGREMTFGEARDGTCTARWQLRSYRPLLRIALRGATGLAESWMAGEWDTPSLRDLMIVAAMNEHSLGRTAEGLSLARACDWLLHRWRRNSRARARRNIAYHYDLGNAFYTSWLDDTMSYSAALFEAPEERLERAQLRKNERLAELLEVGPDSEVLEIGCGWGGFMEHAATTRGAHVTGVSISREQCDYATERLRRAGLESRTTVAFRDYRDLEGSFDRIASVEMFEAVGEAYWDTYAATLKRLLRPRGIAALQVITIDERRFESYRNSTDFIQRYIFPGGMLPSYAALEGTFAKAGLVVTDRFDFGLDYARTLDHWRRRFDRAWPEIARLGFDERFRRLWQFYLAYCEAGFRNGSIDVVQVRLEHA